MLGVGDCGGSGVVGSKGILAGRVHAFNGVSARSKSHAVLSQRDDSPFANRSRAVRIFNLQTIHLFLLIRYYFSPLSSPKTSIYSPFSYRVAYPRIV